MVSSYFDLFGILDVDLEKRWIVQISWHVGLNTGGWGKLLFPVLGGKNCLNLCIAWHERTLAQIFSLNNSNRILLLPLGGNIWHQTPEPSSSFTLSFWKNQAHVHSNFTSWFTLLSSSRFVYERTQMHTNISNDLFLYCQCKTDMFVPGMLDTEKICLYKIWTKGWRVSPTRIAITFLPSTTNLSDQKAMLWLGCCPFPLQPLT